MPFLGCALFESITPFTLKCRVVGMGSDVRHSFAGSRLWLLVTGRSEMVAVIVYDLMRGAAP